jgi:predicted secreted protein
MKTPAIRKLGQRNVNLCVTRVGVQHSAIAQSQPEEDLSMKATYNNAMKYIAIYAIFIWANPVFSQNIRSESPQNILSLQTSGQVEVQQDLLMISMNTTKEGMDAVTVQTQLKTALEAALLEAKKAVLPGQLEVRTGNFNLYPRYGREGKINGWQGSTELVLEGRDFARISSTAGKIQSLTLGQVSFGLSREARARVEGEAQAMAIERFKTKATEVAKGFGLSGFSLREISVNSNDQGGMPRPRMMAMESRAAASDAPVPVEAGRSTVVVTVSGSVQLTGAK